MAEHPIFRPHGQYEASIDGRVLITRVDGSWNIEMHRKMSELSAPLVAELEAGGAWTCLVEVTKTLVGSLDVLAAGRKAVEDPGGPRNLRALAWVIRPDVEAYDLLLPRYRQLYAGVLPTAVFDSVDAARDWLERELAHPAGGDALASR